MAVYIAVGLFIIFDVITGLLKGIYTGTLNSTYLRKGLFRKLSEILTIIGTGAFEYLFTYANLNINIPLVKTVGIYICTMELISILENISEVNPQLGKLFKPYLEKLKERGDKNDKRD